VINVILIFKILFPIHIVIVFSIDPDVPYFEI